MNRLLLLLAALLLTACPSPEPTDDDDSAPEPEPTLPEVVPSEWVENVGGIITYNKSFTSNALEGTECTEVYNLAGANVTEFPPEDCTSCDVVYTMYVNVDPANDCPGDSDLVEEGLIGFDLRQQSGEAVLWFFQEGFFGFGREWIEIGTGQLAGNDETVALDFYLEWDDPNPGNNRTGDDPCGFFSRCEWDGEYIMELALDLDENQVEWE